MSDILSEMIEANSKALPKWTVGSLLPNQPGISHQLPGSAPTLAHRLKAVGLASNGPDPSDSFQDDSDRESAQQEESEGRLAENFAGAFRRAEKDVLDSLDFTLMRDRETEIAAAESATFAWIFQPPKDSDRPWSDFHKWLNGDQPDRLYWINGKAGSGKSTLMKYLVGHHNTRESLKQWAGGTKLLLSSFFFWYSGHDLQKSQIGLLRALLYSCVSNHRELIPIVAPDTATLWEDELRTYWTLPRLREALERLVLQTFYDIKFAFFIDGLDEYAGSYQDIIDILKQLVSCPNVKVCASSRPLLAFERAFASSPHLILQNLTYDDISVYVSKKLNNNEHMQALEISEPGLGARLTSSIVTKASGVFLWVYLVVGSLLDGLGNYDVGADLKRRLDDLPDELEALYWHMVDRVKPKWYLEEGFRLLRMVKASSTNNMTVTLLRLSLAEMPSDLLNTPGLLTTPSLNHQELLCRDMAGRLKSRCLGLLETSGEESDPTGQVVSFIHKSVFDFLETDAAQSRIMACPGHKTFHPETALLKARILELKTLPCREVSWFRRKDWFEWLRPSICDCIKLALAAERASGLPNVKLLRELKAVADEIWESVEPRTYAEEDGSVHWISAHKLSNGLGSGSAEIDPYFDDFLERPPPMHKPASISTFDELCQRAGLDLYAVAAGMKPISAKGRLQSYSPSRKGGSYLGSLAATYDILESGSSWAG